MKRPLTRVEEVRLARGLRKSELSRRAGMAPQTLQRIEDGTTKGLSPSARKKLALPLQIREDQLMMPVGHPIDPLEGDLVPINNLIVTTLQDLLQETREIKELIRSQLQAKPPDEIVPRTHDDADHDLGAVARAYSEPPRPGKRKK